MIDIDSPSVPPELRMFGDILAQFRHMPIETASLQIAGHIRQFWNPRMREKLAAQLAAPSTVEGTDELGAAVAAQLFPR